MFYILEQSLYCFSFISKTSGISDEPALRFPTVKLPLPPSPRKSTDSMIVKLFLDKENFRFYSLLYF